MKGPELKRGNAALGQASCATHLVFRKRGVPQYYILPCSVFQIKVIRFKLFKVLENSERSFKNMVLILAQLDI